MPPRKVIATCLLLGVLLGTGCGEPVRQPFEPEMLVGDELSVGAVVVTHGGVGSPPEWSAACDLAARTALDLLGTGSALDAAVGGTIVLEDEPVFNAGTGANIRLDGKTIQMDAALMTDDGSFAAVAVIERVRNPVAVARAVLDTPHRMLAGEGATRFAHRAGFADEVPTCRQAEDKYLQRMRRLLAGEAGGGYDTFDWRRYWNFPEPMPRGLSAPIGGGNGGPAPLAAPDAFPDFRTIETFDTVGTVVRDADGHFAVTLSTGGTSITLHGRVGDVPIYGCGCYAGPDGAVACTGFGEEIIRRAMARTVYDLMAGGLSAREAVRRGCELFGNEWSLGLIAVGRDGWGVAANRQMAYGVAR